MRLTKLPEGFTSPPIGRYGAGNLDLIANVNGNIWACLINNSPFCPQEFYVWDYYNNGWIDKTHPGSPGPKVPYKTLMKLWP